MPTPLNDSVTLTNHHVTFGRPYYKLSKSAVRFSLAFLEAKLCAFKVWLQSLSNVVTALAVEGCRGWLDGR
jgi:hypothetical protein